MAESSATSWVNRIAALQDRAGFSEQHWEGSFEEYLQLVQRNPRITRTAYQRLFDMIVAQGRREYHDGKERVVHYAFFDDAQSGGQDAVFGLDQPLMRLVAALQSAAQGFGTERRVLLLHGPVGSSKSTIARLLKKGLEAYSKTPEGALYTFAWDLDRPDGGGRRLQPCPMHEEPLHLIPPELRQRVVAELCPPGGDFSIPLDGELCPACRYVYQSLLDEAGGDWARVAERVRVRRLVLSEKDRVGVGTFQPKDEKNQDSTELTGDVNYRKIAEYGSDSDPRAFNFDGELNIANRGLVEFVEILKLDVAFLYDLLGATQEHKIKPKKFPQTDIDEVIIGHTNEPEYRRLQSNEFMEALRDRTVKIDIPYITRLVDEVRIYERDYGTRRVAGKHIAPHTLEMAAMWAVLTRLDPPKKASLTLLQKLKLYNGKMLPGFTEDNVKELHAEAVREGMEGISPRYVQDKVSNALVSDRGEGCVNPFMVLNELEAGLQQHSLISSEEQRKRFRDLLGDVKLEYEDVVKNEVQRAIAADEDAVTKLCASYVEHLKAYTQREKVRNKYTGQYEEPNERLMRSIEEKIDIPESRKDIFRGELMNFLGALAVEGRPFNYKTNERLHKALELKLFEDQKDTIKLRSLVSSVVDRETQEKIDVVRQRLIKGAGYCEICSTDVLNFVASIFARGDAKESR